MRERAPSRGATPRAAPVRLIDVARATGVHVSTVSRALHGGADTVIKEATRERIVETARSLGYRPHAGARSMRLASTGAIGLLVPTLRNPLWAEITRGAFDRAWERGCVVVLAEEGSRGLAVEAYGRLVLEGRIDGLLIGIGSHGDRLARRCELDGFPHIFLNRRSVGSGRNVAMDEEGFGRLLAEHLVELGHRRVGYIDGLPDEDTARRRLGAFASTCALAGVQVVAEGVEYTEAAGWAAATALLALPEPPTAIAGLNVLQAIGALRAIREQGLSVPHDLSVISYDDDSFFDYLDVPLTAVRKPVFELGAAGVDALLDQVAGAAPSDIVLASTPQIIERGSTAALVASRPVNGGPSHG